MFENILDANVLWQASPLDAFARFYGSGRDVFSCSYSRHAVPLPQTSCPWLKWLKGQIQSWHASDRNIFFIFSTVSFIEGFSGLGQVLSAELLSAETYFV